VTISNAFASRTHSALVATMEAQGALSLCACVVYSHAVLRVLGGRRKRSMSIGSNHSPLSSRFPKRVRTKRASMSSPTKSAEITSLGLHVPLGEILVTKRTVPNDPA
jgi:hypothetical protein